VSELDRRPIAEVIEELNRQHPPLLGMPVFGRRYDSDITVIRIVRPPDDADKRVHFSRAVNLGDTLYLLQATADEMRKAAEDAFEIARQKESGN
jgi:hypothetical protein